MPPQAQERNSYEKIYIKRYFVVRLGDRGGPFIMHLYDNDTASAIARHVGMADWRLPIYNYEGYENWEVIQ